MHRELRFFRGHYQDVNYGVAVEAGRNKIFVFNPETVVLVCPLSVEQQVELLLMKRQPQFALKELTANDSTPKFAKLTVQAQNLHLTILSRQKAETPALEDEITSELKAKLVEYLKKDQS